MKKQNLVLVFILSALVLSGSAVLAAEQISPAKAAARKKAEEKLKKQGAPSAADSGAKSSVVDLNKASKQQLMTLPGIGETEADKIIAARPFISKTQLRQKGILPSAAFYEIIDKVSVDITVKKYEPPPPPPVKKKDDKPERKPDTPKKDVFKDFGK